MAKKNIFSKIYYINLDRNLKRKEYMENNYQNLTRISAIDGNSFNFEEKNGLNKYEIGCIQSHLKAIKRAYDDGCNEALIMEDDMMLEFIDKWKYSIEEIIKKKPQNANCIILHCINPKEIELMINSNQLFSKWKRGRWSTGCYYINKNGMVSIINKFSLNHIPNEPADFFLYKNLKCFNYHLPLFNSLCESEIPKQNSVKNINNIHKKANFIIKKYFDNL